MRWLHLSFYRSSLCIFPQIEYSAIVPLSKRASVIFHPFENIVATLWGKPRGSNRRNFVILAKELCISRSKAAGTFGPATPDPDGLPLSPVHFHFPLFSN